MFTPLSKSFHSIMNMLSTANLITLPPSQPLLLSIMATKSFDLKVFYQYHFQNGHDIEKCYSLKYKAQDLINSNSLYIDNFDGSGNKYFFPPNQNFQIYMNPLPTHDTNTIAQPSSMNIVHDSKMDDLNHMVNQVDHVIPSISPPQSQPMLQ